MNDDTHTHTHTHTHTNPHTHGTSWLIPIFRSIQSFQVFRGLSFQTFPDAHYFKSSLVAKTREGYDGVLAPRTFIFRTEVEKSYSTYHMYDGKCSKSNKTNGDIWSKPCNSQFRFR